MNFSVFTSPAKSSPKLTYDVLIEPEKDGGFSAAVIGLPNCRATGATKEEALTRLGQLLTARLQEAEIVSLEIEPSTEHPWMKFAGKYKDDPQFEQMLEYIEANRRELDVEMEAYYRQLDSENQAK